MLYTILCEGKTDSFILNQFMTLQGFKFIGKNQVKNIPKFKLLKNQEVDYFKYNDTILAIWNVAGCGNFKSSINEIKKVLSNFFINSLAIVTDRDFNEVPNIEKDISFCFDSTFSLEDNSWIKYEYMDNFGVNRELKTLLLILPKGKFGALETVMLDVLKSQGKEERNLVLEIDMFIEKLHQMDFSYLKKDRNIIKSKLGCTVNIMDPERTFKDIISTFYNIPWGENEIIKKYFQELKNYE